jgi:hypothetical protein
MFKTYLAHAMAQAVSDWPVIAEAWVQSHAIPCETSGGQSGMGFSTNFSYKLIHLLLMLCNLSI